MSSNASASAASSSSSSSSSAPSRPADINSTDSDVLMDKCDDNPVQLQLKSKSKKLSGKIRRRENDGNDDAPLESQALTAASASDANASELRVSKKPKANGSQSLMQPLPTESSANAAAAATTIRRIDTQFAPSRRPQRHSAQASEKTLELLRVTSPRSFLEMNRVRSTELAVAIFQEDAARVANNQPSQIDLIAPYYRPIGEGISYPSFLLLQLLEVGGFLRLCEQSHKASKEVVSIVAPILPHLSYLIRLQLIGANEELRKARQTVLDVLVSRRNLKSPRSEWRLSLIRALMQAGADPNEPRCGGLNSWPRKYSQYSCLLAMALCNYPDAEGLIILLEAGAQPSTEPETLLEVLVRRQAANSLRHLSEAAPKLASLDFSKALRMSQDQVQSANEGVKHAAAMATQAALTALQGECISWLNMAEGLVHQVAPFPEMASVVLEFLHPVPTQTAIAHNAGPVSTD